ncbi:pyridine nucleotide-disulfide oxidoreductase [Prauserella marina]|uniref:Phthalate 3,4-dioxygenase ferredoxin reductase subunit n=1 Tax=Prauserella marina TaxID=530584 RepID=A0A222VP85_9PSEU|nr:FAD/NAD(P)-binding oxidoreductase [Prauserella marina]ASR35694.1 pyridine nucleotide-disulfide oxidoreductase [Prauserella marina]PWV84429.1 phthalate 3,4-dioxygenase ferredoxin reductase subunit [Prauserella marina]SDC22786.1 phthalate 3,4-dioxygenase ferredoxin reductase subunit [Prauserella marina]
MNPVTVIVGSSIGGVRTAQALRASGYDGEVLLVGEETALPYDKPPLSKGLLAGKSTVEDITLLTEEAAAEAGIRLVPGRAATGLDVAGRWIELADGERLRFDDLVIATGARARPSPWGGMPGVHVLRTLGDAEALARDLGKGGPLVVIGAGFIGAEVAATARDMGVEDVTLVDPAPAPLHGVLGPELADWCARLHAGNGVTTRFGVGVDGIDRSAEGLLVRLADGKRFPAATVVVGIGAVPCDDWLRSSCLRLDDGVVCDAYGRAAENVYAVGDVARVPHPRKNALVRAEHWTSTVEQAARVAHNIARKESPRAHEPVEYVWSDQYDNTIQITGHTGGPLSAVTVPGPDPGRAFARLYAEPDGSFAGAVTVNWPRALITCRKAVGSAASLEEIRGSVSAKRPVTKTGARP